MKRVAWLLQWLLPWILPWLLALAGLSVFWSHATPHLCYTSYWLSGDSGIAVYNAWQVADGRLIYRDFFEYRTPLFFYVWGAIFALAGPSPAWAQWANLVCVSSVAPLMTVVLHRLGCRKLLATAASVATVLVCFAVWPFPYPPWLGWLMVALAAWAFERAFHLSGSDSPDRGWIVRAGLFTGLFVLTIQSSGLFFALGATVGLALAVPRRRLAATGWFVAGGLAAAAPFLGFLALKGELGEALWQTLIWTNTHYYNGFIKGAYPFAGIVEYWQRRGLCQVGTPAINHVYTVSVAAIPALGISAFAASLWAAGKAWRQGIRSSREAVLCVLSGAGVVAFVPHVIFPSLSDPVHVSMATITVAIPMAVLLGHGSGALRFVGRAFLYGLAVVALLVACHRAWRWEPFGQRYRDYDGFVKKYANVGLWEQLTEPGDTWAHMAYGGWQYLTTKRHSGIAHTTVFNDEKYMSKRELDRIVRNIRERTPTLLVFTEEGHQRTLWALDPTLAERYFWNGAAWERRDPPLPYEILAPVYRTAKGDTLAVTQDGQELGAKEARVELKGSIRGSRMFLTGPGRQYLLRRQSDGTLVGQCGAAPCRLEPVDF